MFMRFLICVGLLFSASDLEAKNPKNRTVPISGSISGYVLPFIDDLETIEERCSPPDSKCAWAIASFLGWGTLSHLGESELYAEHCSYGTLVESICNADGTYGEGEITAIASNGDVLKATYDNGTSTSPPIALFTDEFTFVDGGTGRFEQASGSGVEVGFVDFSGEMPPPFTVYMEGEIAYKKKPPNTITLLDDTSPDVGRSNSIAIGSDGLPVIAYFDLSNQLLKVAKCKNVRCSSAIISTVGAARGYGSLAIGSDGLPVISYAAPESQSLLVAKCNDMACSGGDEYINVVDERSSGRNSIAIGADGLPVISYHGYDNKLLVAKCNDPACSGGDETISTLNDPSPHTGGQSSIAVPEDGLPVISYKQLTGAPIPSYLMVAKCNDAACSGADETISQVAQTGIAMFESTAITLAEDGLPLIAFNDTGEGTIIVIKCNDPACSGGDEVENLIDEFTGSQFVSVAVGADGRPVLAFNGTMLVVARCHDPACTGGEATISHVDPVRAVATSIAIGSDGLPVVSYFEFSNPPNQFKVVHCGSEGC